MGGPSWGAPNIESMRFPVALEVDWIRVYQPEGVNKTSCDPPDAPTKEYVAAHMDMYVNSSLSRWAYPIPEYSLPKHDCPDNCNSPQGKCSLLSAKCACNVGFGGDDCSERTVTGICAELLL